LSLYLPPWNNTLEPSQNNIRQWLDNLQAKCMPVEQARWNQSNIDSLFYAGSQTFVNRYFGFQPTSNASQYYFNLVQQPVNMITGYQRQHRKSINYVPTEGSDPNTTDQYTRLMTHVCNNNGIHEQMSKAYELSAISGLVMVQPYLDYTTDDHAQGELKLKIWEYNSFLVDPYAREPDFSDAQYMWFQEYISKQVARDRFGERAQEVSNMVSAPKAYGNFYFLPENYNMAKNDLLVLSYVWYKWKTRKKRLYSRSKNMFYDFAGGDENLEKILYHIEDLEAVTVEVPCWKLATVLNDQLMYLGENPMGDIGVPAVPVFWNYDPHVNQYDLRVRSLVRTMRDANFLFNYKVIQNNDIAAATINAGWKRKSGAVANEDNLKKSGQGWDIIINDGYEMTDVEKIIPSAVPESDLALAEQMSRLVFQTSGIDLENWSGQNDKIISSLTMMLKQAANLMVFQKYFDQWDYAFKKVGNKLLQIVLYNWNAAKVGMLIGEEPSPHFFSRIFAKYQVIVEEGLLTPTQKNFQAQQMLEINERFGREVLPASMIIKDMNIQGKTEIMEYLQQQEMQAAAVQNEAQNIQHAFEEMKMKELIAKIHNQLSMARERDSRAESNVGLFEERMSMISKNHALASKEKMAALTALLESIQKFGELETYLQANNLESIKYDDEETEKISRQQVERTEASKKFMQQIMMAKPQQQTQEMQGQPQQEMAGQAMQ